jgi:hypothetical protein
MKQLIFILSISIALLTSCHNAKYHLKKFYKNGGKFNCDTTMIMMSDTIKINGKDSIIYRTFNTVCPDVQVPKTIRQTRIELRFDYKKFNDSLKHIRKVYSSREDFLIDSLKQVRKTEVKIKRVETKNRFWIGFFIGLVASILARTLSRIFVKRLFS